MTTTTIDSTVTGITEAYKNALINIAIQANNNDNVIKINGNVVNVSEINNVEIYFLQLTHSGRKKIAKRISNYDKKRNLKTINFMFHVMNKMNVTKDKVTIGISSKEAEIQSVRKMYVRLRAETEIARINYKFTKGDFYK